MSVSVPEIRNGVGCDWREGGQGSGCYDDMLLRWHASEMLADNGYHVLEAEDAARALKILESSSDVRLLFTDVQMPGAKDGVALAEEVHRRWPHVLLIVTSAGTSIENKDLPDGGRFISKPYEEHQIMDEISSIVSKKS